MRIAYIAKRFQGASEVIIDTANVICAEYRAQGYDLTLRQLYYQFVARGLLPNSDKSYKKLGGIVNDARLAGRLDWNYITDRTRNLNASAGGWDSAEQIIDQTADAFRRDLWAVTDQQYRPEIWVEKEALAGVIGRTARALDVPFFSCRGYVSQSEMWAAGQRMRKHLDFGLTPIVIHLGDHDPSGLDMTRDITERLAMFAETPITVHRIALNWDQIEEFNPPPNPAKLTDSRGSAYVEEYGDESWELDALDPTTLDGLMRDALEPYIDTEAWREGEAEDEDTRDAIRRIASRWTELGDNWDDIIDIIGES